ncbi:MAG: phosphoribosylaminoimidazolesuccinocarboxamide synthase, partial [Candidatus Marsarchaeota archaeon]|nr:phosphoribosylaminoimidazolesuccinocarboxamide synthase [Candidatus Marsarchaeota archaeon]
STKSQTGHDQNITFEQLTAEIGREKTSMLKEITLAVYEHAHNYALPRGIIIADTKLEFGINGSEQLVLIDELLTPDSSRFWPSDTYLPGGPQISYDKQYVRDYVESVGWNKSPDNIPVLPEDVIANTSKKYIQAFETLSGSIFRTL